MPYRAQLGGVFGSGLYPNQRQGGQAAEVIDAVTRGATTLIQGAFARAQKRREQQMQDAELARRDRTEQREVEKESFARDMAVRKEARDVETQQRADATAGYTPTRIEEKETVEPGSVETNGVFGAPGKVTAPSIKKQRMTIPGALDYTKSNAYRARAQTHDIKETERDEHITDSEKIHQANRQYDVDHPMPSRSGSGRSAADASDVHASAAVRAQISEVNGSIKSLEAQKVKLAPTIYEGKEIGGNPAEVAKIDKQLEPLYVKRDSLRTVNERIGGKLTDKAGISRTISGALGGKKKEAAGPAKGTITQQEAAALRKQGFTMDQITAKYSIQ